MSKTADTEVPLLDPIAQRWSPRAFSEREPTLDELTQVFEAARWAASCYNAQPWRFIVARKSEGQRHADVAAGFNEFNRAWAASAPVVGFTLANRNLDNGKPNRHAWFDAGAAVAQLSIQAASLGLMVHQMAGIEREVVRERFAVPDELEVVAGFAIGWPGDPAVLSDKLRERELAPRARKPLSELLIHGWWG